MGVSDILQYFLVSLLMSLQGRELLDILIRNEGLRCGKERKKSAQVQKADEYDRYGEDFLHEISQSHCFFGFI